MQLKIHKGQWKYPNRCTMIPSKHITMQNVSYPVLGIDDTGYKQVMTPEKIIHILERCI
jgi:hypothetical protein